MKAFVRALATWTPERGALSAEDGLARLCRFSRTCAAVLDEIRGPEVETPLVVGTATGAAESPRRVAEELRERWPGSDVHLVTSGLETVPASLLEAMCLLTRCDEVSWVVVDLQPGAELVGAFTLANQAPGRRLTMLRMAEAAEPFAAHLNPCAGVLSLGVAPRDEGVSIKVGRWSLALDTTG